MTTIQEIITDSLTDLGAIAVGETPTAAESIGALRALNNLLEQWNTESLIVYNITPNTFAYVGGQASYTMGTGGNFNAARPVTIERAYNRQYAGSQNQIDLEIYVTTNFAEYSDIQAKAIQTSLPVVMYDDGGFPLKTLYFWPVPSGTTYTPVLWYWTVIASFAGLSDSVSLPPGYKRALQKNLAIELSPSYGKEPSTILTAHAIESKAQIKRVNTEIQELRFSPNLPGGAGGRYSYQDFLSGQ